MARTEIPIVVIDPATGNAVTSASVTVVNRATSANATIYAGETGATSVANPRVTDSNGRLTGWVERGGYRLDITGSGLTAYSKNWDSAPAADSSIDALWLGTVTPATALVSALPGSPVDGQDCFYQSTAAGSGGGSATMASVGAVWHLRYRSASASAYKWEFVGGGTVRTADATQRMGSSVANGALSSLPTAMNITAPLVGDYFTCGAGTFYTNNGANANVTMYVGYKVGSTAPTVFGENQQTTQNFVQVTQETIVTVASLASSGGVIEQQVAQYSGATRNIYGQNRFMSLVPVRVG